MSPDPDAAHRPSPSGPADDWLGAAEARLVSAAQARGGGDPFDRRFLQAVGADAGLSEAELHLVAPGGLRDLVSLLFARHDADALTMLESQDPSALKVRERIFQAVRARVEAAAADASLVRRASFFLAHPGAARLGVELGWRTADLLWRWAGDRAADENHYSKRLILSGLLVSVLQARLNDGPEAADARLRAGIDAVMRFETLKAKLPRPEDVFVGLAARLGAVRHAGRRRPGAAERPPARGSAG